MPLPDKHRAPVRQALNSMDFHPWHRCRGLLVWRRGLQEWSFTGPAGGEIVHKSYGLDDAVDFVMRNGLQGEPGGWPGTRS